MNRKISLGATIGLIALAVALSVTLTMQTAMRLFDRSVAALSERQALYSHIDAVDKLVRQCYTNIDEEGLRAELAEGYIAGIGDPYAAYLSTDDCRIAELFDAGQLEGFGFEYQITASGVTVTFVHANSPAGKAGVEAGDVITSVNETAVDASNRSALLTGIEGTKNLLLGVTRDEKPLSFDLAAATFEMTTVKERLIGTIGYIRVRALCENTFAEFKAAYSAMEAAGATSFIYDLRGTSKGVVDTADAMLNYLLPRCNYAYMEYYTGESVQYTVSETHQSDAPTVILVDKSTACAAELFAAAMQKFGHATVIGTKTAGKGKVQERFAVKTDNSAVQLTVGQVYLYGGTAIEGVGVMPSKLAVSDISVQNKSFELLDEYTDVPLSMAVTQLIPNYFQVPTTEPTTETEEPALPTVGEKTITSPSRTAANINQ